MEENIRMAEEFIREERERTREGFKTPQPPPSPHSSRGRPQSSPTGATSLRQASRPTLTALAPMLAPTTASCLASTHGLAATCKQKSWPP